MIDKHAMDHRSLAIEFLESVRVSFTEWEGEMTRLYIDCREFPSETKCSVSMAADSPQELLEVAMQHAVTVHGHQDSSELRNQIGKCSNR